MSFRIERLYHRDDGDGVGDPAVWKREGDGYVSRVSAVDDLLTRRDQGDTAVLGQTFRVVEFDS